MRLGVYALGLLLVVVGVVCVAIGSQIIRLEQGWTEVIAGSVAGSAGFIILVLGVMIARLDALGDAIREWGVVERLHAPLRASDAPSEAPVWPAAEPAEEAARDLPQADPLQPELPLHPKPDAYPAAPVEVEPEPAFDYREPVIAEHRAEQVVENDHRGQEAAPAIELPSPPPVVELVETAVPERRSSRFISSILTRAAALQLRKPFETPPPRVQSPVQPSLVPIEETVQPNAPPPRTSVDLSSGWPDLVPETPQVQDRPHEKPFEAPVHPHADTEAESHRPEADQHSDEEEHHEPEQVWEPEIAEAAPVPSEAAEPEPLAAAMTEPHPLRPTIVGRYNAGSASYVMYSNGMIEVETATGTHQFESMQELKAFIERQDAGRV